MLLESEAGVSARALKCNVNTKVACMHVLALIMILQFRLLNRCGGHE